MSASTASFPSRMTGVRLRASALCLIGWIIAAIAWVIGARFTIDGLLVIVAWLLRFLTVPIQLGPAPWWLYLVLAPLPIWCSTIEWGDNPVQLVRREGWTLAFAGSVCVWLIVVSADAVSTLVGLDHYDPGSSSVLQFFLATAPGLILATALLTFWPEWLARTMATRWRTIWE